jgi:hypothetical protein
MVSSFRQTCALSVSSASLFCLISSSNSANWARGPCNASCVSLHKKAISITALSADESISQKNGLTQTAADRVEACGAASAESNRRSGPIRRDVFEGIFSAKVCSLSSIGAHEKANFVEGFVLGAFLPPICSKLSYVPRLFLLQP